MREREERKKKVIFNTPPKKQLLTFMVKEKYIRKNDYCIVVKTKAKDSLKVFKK